MGLRILNLGMDTSTPTGKLLLIILGGIAQFEGKSCQSANERGFSKAKADGKYKGRKAIHSDKKQEVVRLVTSGMSKADVARQLEMGEATVYRIINSCKTTQNGHINYV